MLVLTTGEGAAATELTGYKQFGSEDDQVISSASSVTLAAQSPLGENAMSSGRISVDIQRTLTSQQAMLPKLPSASEAVSAPATAPESIYEPPTARYHQECTIKCPLCTPEGTYENARIEAGFSSWSEWTAAYIHGMIRIDGRKSKSTLKNSPCGACERAHKFAVCVGLGLDDPYRKYLVDVKGVCCGWCEYEKYEKTEDEEAQRRKEHRMAMTASSSGDESWSVYTEENSDLNESNRRRSDMLSAGQSEYFISGEGIDPEVITNDIPLYLGHGSVVRPGAHYDIAAQERTEGYYIIAHRPLTSAMLADLRSDSTEWQREKERRRREVTAGNREGGYSCKQPSRYQTYCFQFPDANK